MGRVSLASRHPDFLALLATLSTGYAITAKGKAIDGDFTELVREGGAVEAWEGVLSGIERHRVSTRWSIAAQLCLRD